MNPGYRSSLAVSVTTQVAAPNTSASPSYEFTPTGGAPRRLSNITAAMAWELGGSALAALAFVWLVFTIAGVSASFGLLVSWLLAFAILYAVVCWRRHGTLVMKDRLAAVVMWTGALCAFVPLVALSAYVVFQGAPVALARFPHFFVADMSDLAVSAHASVSAVGAGAAIVGTLEEVGLAAAMAVPLGLLTATYLADHKGRFARGVGSVVDATTGAPAIIFGLAIYIVWVVPQKTAGKSGFAAAMALALMMLPIVTRAAQEVITIVPESLREAALALGAPKWRVMVRVVLPTARAGIATAVILGIARVAGETAPILFCAGGNSSFNWNPFSGPQDNLPFRIYELIFQPSEVLVRDAWGVSFVLVLVVLILFIVARRVGASAPGRRGLISKALQLRQFRPRPGGRAAGSDPISLSRSDSQ